MILVDTAPLLAMLHVADQQHRRCLKWYDMARGPLLVPQTVMVEAAYMVSQRCGPKVEAELVRSMGPGGPFDLVAIQKTDMLRIAHLVEKYSDFPLGVVDASVIAVAERLNITTIATLDVRHFAAVRPNHTESFVLVPE